MGLAWPALCTLPMRTRDHALPGVILTATARRKMSLVTSRMNRARAVFPEFWRFVRCRCSDNAAPLQFQPRSRPCFAPTVLPRAHCISPHKGGPSSTKPDAGCPTVRRRRQRATRQDIKPTRLPNVTPSAIPRCTGDSYGSFERIAVSSTDAWNSHLSAIGMRRDAAVAGNLGTENHSLTLNSSKLGG